MLKQHRDKPVEWSFGDNCFDWIRLYAAWAVMWGHACTHLQMNGVNQFVGVRSMFSGVFILFVLSAYLGTASYERNLDKYGGDALRQYARSRVVRVYPALWAAFAVSVVSILVLYDGEASAAGVVKWVAAQLTVGQFYTPDFLRGYGVGTPNGSLWTIPVTIQFYILIPLIYKVMKNARPVVWAAAIAAAAGLSCMLSRTGDRLPVIVDKLIGVSFLPYLYLLLAGMFIYLRRERIIPFLIRYYFPILLVYLVYHALNAKYGIFTLGVYHDIITGLFTCVVTIATAYKAGRDRLGFDISYGVYLYHMILVNICVELGWTNSLPAFAGVILLSIACGFASWYLVEKPVAKRFGSGKALRKIKADNTEGA